MQIIIICLVALCLLLLLALLVRTGDRREGNRVKSVLNEGFISFQKNIQETMDSTRREVESSKTVLSQNTIKTLETIKDVEQTLERVMKYQDEANKLGESLRYLLESPKLRGNYGEEILEEMLGRVLPKGIWERQYAIEGRETADAVVKFKEVIIPIDAKFPRDDFERYSASEDPEEKKGLWKQFESCVKRQVKSIEQKYIRPESGTSEFALMFIPSEAIYYETIAATNEIGHPNTLHEYAQSHRVIPVSPNTFYAFLQVIIMGIRNLEIIQGARELQQNLSAVERDFELFFKKFEDIGSRLEKASESYRIGRGHAERYKKRLDATLNLELPEEDTRPIPEKTGNDAQT